VGEGSYVVLKRSQPIRRGRNHNFFLPKKKKKKQGKSHNNEGERELPTLSCPAPSPLTFAKGKGTRYEGWRGNVVGFLQGAQKKFLVGKMDWMEKRDRVIFRPRSEKVCPFKPTRKKGDTRWGEGKVKIGGSCLLSGSRAPE